MVPHGSPVCLQFVFLDSPEGLKHWGKVWWPETGSNRRRRPFQGRALPLSYLALGIQGRCFRFGCF
jgi:hypothetical protein